MKWLTVSVFALVMAGFTVVGCATGSSPLGPGGGGPGGAGGAGCRGGGEGGEEAPALDGGAVVDCDEGGGGEVGCVCVCEGVGCPEGEGEEEEGEEVHGVWVLGT